MTDIPNRNASSDCEAGEKVERDAADHFGRASTMTR